MVLKQGCNSKCLFYVLLNQTSCLCKVCQFVFGSGEAHQKAAQSVAVKPLSQAVCAVNKMFHHSLRKKNLRVDAWKQRVVMSKNRTAEFTHSNWVFNEMKGSCCRGSTVWVCSAAEVCPKGVKSEADHPKLCINRPFGLRSVQKSYSAQSPAVNYKSRPGAVLESQTFQGLIVSSHHDVCWVPGASRSTRAHQLVNHRRVVTERSLRLERWSCVMNPSRWKKKSAKFSHLHEHRPACCLSSYSAIPVFHMDSRCLLLNLRACARASLSSYPLISNTSFCSSSVQQ